MLAGAGKIISQGKRQQNQDVASSQQASMYGRLALASLKPISSSPWKVERTSSVPFFHALGVFSSQYVTPLN
jgi:hypothetical protein